MVLYVSTEHEAIVTKCYSALQRPRPVLQGLRKRGLYCGATAATWSINPYIAESFFPDEAGLSPGPTQTLGLRLGLDIYEPLPSPTQPDPALAITSRTLYILANISPLRLSLHLEPGNRS